MVDVSCVTPGAIARDYCQGLPQVTGTDYRLASEAEWEKTARDTDVGPAYRGGSIGFRVVVRPAS